MGLKFIDNFVGLVAQDLGIPFGNLIIKNLINRRVQHICVSAIHVPLGLHQQIPEKYPN